jgi:DNA-binding NtrC family response regulator
MEALRHFPWPGNIRQLQNVIEACLAIETGEIIGLPLLAQFIDLTDVPTTTHLDEIIEKSDYTAAIAEFEAAYLAKLLRRSHGNIEEAAREAGMNMATIYRKIKKYGLKRDDYL